MNDFLARQLFDFLSCRRAGDEIDFPSSRLNKLAQDDVPAAVAVQKHCRFFLPAQVCDRLPDVSPADCDDVLDVVAQHVYDVRPAFDDDYFLALVQARPCRQSLAPVRNHVSNFHFLPDHFAEFLALGNFFRQQSLQQNPRPFEDGFPLQVAGIFDAGNGDFGVARPNPVHYFQRGSENAGFNHVQARRDDYGAHALSFAHLHFNFNAPYAPVLLEFAQIQLVAEKPFGLPEYRSDDVGLFNEPVYLVISLYQILDRVNVRFSHALHLFP